MPQEQDTFHTRTPRRHVYGLLFRCAYTFSMVVAISCKRISKAIQLKRDTKGDEKNVILDIKKLIYLLNFI